MVMPFDSYLVGIFAIVESVERATNCGVFAPGIRRAVIRICDKFGVLATIALDLSGEVAFVIRLNEHIDAVCKPFRPLVLDQGGGIGETGALDVRILVFAKAVEDPLSGEL